LIKSIIPPERFILEAGLSLGKGIYIFPLAIALKEKKRKIYIPLMVKFIASHTKEKYLAITPLKIRMALLVLFGHTAIETPKALQYLKMV